MTELVFLLEEASAQAMLEVITPKFVPTDISVRYMVFEGKQDLERRLFHRLRGYLNPDARFIVIRDQDSAPDCLVIKNRLAAICRDAGHPNVVIRIFCRELETIYLADLAAVEKAYGIAGIAKRQLEGKFRRPDMLGSPSRELRQLTKGRYQKIGGSRAIAEHLALENDRSSSFFALVNGIRRALADFPAAVAV